MTMLAILALAGSIAVQAATQPLRIVVLEGEGAVNIVQQKTAVRPLVEVRDRNGLPAPGATVTFTIGSGQPASFGGAQTLTVTTNTAGRAAATGYQVSGAGRLQIQVQAAYQGQAATTLITQTSFITASAAAAATAAGVAAPAAGGATTTAATGAAAGGGGGISATTIGVIGAAAGGGALVAAQQAGVLGGGDDDDAFDVFRGSFTSPFTLVGTSSVGPAGSCTWQRTMTGTIEIQYNAANGTGRAYVEGTQNDVSVTGSCGSQPETRFSTPDTTASGGPSALTFTSTRGEISQRTTVTFSGSYSGNTISGTLTVETFSQTTTTSGIGTTTQTRTGSATLPVTLQRTTGTVP